MVREDIETLFARNLPFVRAFVRLRLDPIVRDLDGVSDVVQSACREVIENEAFEFRGEAAFRSYLCQAALHKIQNKARFHRAQKRRPAGAKVLQEDEAALEQAYRTTLFDPQHTAIRAEAVVRLEAAFEKLPADYREALTLYRIAGMSLPDLARHLGRSEAATQSLVSRAMARLAVLLGKAEKGRE